MKNSMFIHRLQGRLWIAFKLACMMPVLFPLMATLFLGTWILIGVTMVLVLMYILIMPIIVIFNHDIAKELGKL